MTDKIMTTEKGIKQSTAITTWSGFVYQGKVALFHSLKLISNEIQDYTLQLELTDDFAIYKGEKCKSKHQVKAYKNRNFSKCRPAIERLEDEHKKLKAEESYLHVSREIKDFPDNYKSEYPNTSIYNYGGDKQFCELDEINDLIEELIKEIYQSLYSKEEHKLKDEYCELTRILLEECVVDKVLDIHKQIQEEGKAGKKQVEIASEEKNKIKFSELISIFESNLNLVNKDEEFYYPILKRLTLDAFEYYFYECEEDGEECDEEKLRKYMSLISGMSKEELKTFFKKISPDRKGEFDTAMNFKVDTPQKENLEECFLVILNKLRAIKINEEGVDNPFLWFLDGEFYYPTALRGENERSICRKIIKNFENNNIEELFESGNLVTKSLEVNDIYGMVNSKRKIVNEEGMDVKRKQNKPKVIKLIKLDNVPQGLVDE